MTTDPIDRLLDAEPAIPDDGFTRRVMAALPPARPAPRPLEGWLVALAAGLVAAVLAPEVAGVGRALADGSSGLASLALALSGSAGSTAVPTTLLAAAFALGVAALGSWLVARAR
jgi:hypothetical protein